MVDTVKTVKSSGGDYSSLAAWEAGQQKVISAGDAEIAECYAFSDTTAVTIDGWTTVATGYIEIRVPSAERHTGVAGTGYRLSQSADFTRVLLIAEEFTRVIGVSLTQLNASTFCYATYSISTTVAATSDNRLIDSLMLGGFATSTESFGIEHSSGIFLAVNCVVADTHPVAAKSSWQGSQPDASYYNCTLRGSTTGIRVDSRTYPMKNCYVSGGTTCYDIFSGSISATTCQHSNTETLAGSSDSVAYSTANFNNVTAGSDDLGLPSGSALVGAGTDLSADSLYPFSTDIVGVSRTPGWGVGAFHRNPPPPVTPIRVITSGLRF
jgi:hypothetical protein